MRFFSRKKTEEQILKETSLQEKFKTISPTKSDYDDADEQMSEFLGDNKKELELNSLELDKHMVSISGGGIILMVAFLSFVEIDNLSDLRLKQLGFVAIITLTLCILSVVLSCMFAVKRARNGIDIGILNKKISKYMHKRPQDEEYWKGANALKNKFCDLVKAGRRCNSAVHYSMLSAPSLFIVGILSLAFFGMINLAQLSGMDNDDDNSQGGDQQTHQEPPKKLEKAADLPDALYDEVVNDTLQMMNQEQEKDSEQDS